MRFPHFLLGLFTLVIASSFECQSAESGKLPKEQIQRLPIPKWVNTSVIDPEAETPKNDTRNGTWYLLSDNQVNIQTAESFQHVAYRFLNPTGLSEHSQLSFSFDPKYQELALNRLIIHRDQEQIDRLKEVEIRVIESESGHERQLYNGSKTALLILKDIRVGDILEYAFTIKGTNPVFGGRHCSFHQLGYAVSVGKIHRRVIWDPKARKLNHKLFNTEQQAVISNKRGLKEIVWEIENSPSNTRDSSTPGWHLSQPLLQLSEFQSWKDFSSWVTPLFSSDSELPEDLKEECNRIRELDSDSKRVMASLQYVQDNIRYLGSFMGTHTHKPYPLETIYNRRFGDCKDKSMLLCAMLKELGYDAVPALVDTSETKAITHYLPGYFNFNHAITCLRLDGKNYWLDGTRSYQGGHLHNFRTATYAYAFVIDGKSTDLTPVKGRGKAAQKTIISEHFRVPDLSGTMHLRVSTTAIGEAAENFRRYFANNDIKKVTKDYQKFYARAYPEIEAEGVTFTDDRSKNIFTVSESYKITDFWTPIEDNESMLEGWFEAQSMYQKIDKPSTSLRRMPYEIYHPINLHQIITIDMPIECDFSPIDKKIENDAFKFTSNSDITPTSIKLNYRLLTKQDHVPLRSIKQYISDCEDAENQTYYQLSFAKSYTESGEYGAQPKVLSFLLILSLIGAAVFGLLASIFSYFYDPSPKALVEPHDLNGLSGWLVLVAVGICLGPFIQLSALADNGDFFDGTTLNNLLESEMYVNLVTIVVGITSTSFLIPAYILLIILFFKKRSSFPRLFIIISIISLAVEVVTLGLLRACDGITDADFREAVSETIRLFISLAIWISYILTSKRVKNTFRITRKNPTANPGLPPKSPPPLPPKIHPKIRT